jgi:hypothetical protein
VKLLQRATMISTIENKNWKITRKKQIKEKVNRDTKASLG